MAGIAYAGTTSTLAEKDSSFSKFESTQLDAEKRLLKWQLQREARALLPNERVAFCMRRVKGATVDVFYSPDHQSAHYGGLMVCGSVWVCPVCAIRISEKRRVELEQAIARCIADGGVVYLATYTIAHKRFDSLSALLKSFLAARKRAKQGRNAQELRKQFGVIGTVSVREVTWSKENGWHPHCHELVFFSSDIDADEYARIVREQWQQAAEHEGLSMNEHGFKLDRACGAVANYIAKFGREPIKIPWGPSAEMTKGHLKQGHSEEHLTPFAMLLLISQGRNELKPVFREYAQWFKGKHQLVWSAGLRSRLLDSEEDPSDLELAQQPEEETILLGQLTQSQWRIVLVHDARGKLLEVARYGDWQMVVTFLTGIGDEHGPSPPISLGLITRLVS